MILRLLYQFTGGIFYNYSQSSPRGHPCKQTALITAALTNSYLNSPLIRIILVSVSQIQL